MIDECRQANGLPCCVCIFVDADGNLHGERRAQQVSGDDSYCMAGDHWVSAVFNALCIDILDLKSMVLTPVERKSRDVGKDKHFAPAHANFRVIISAMKYIMMF